MTLLDALTARAGGACELCGAGAGLTAFLLAPRADGSAETAVLVCETCRAGLEGGDLDPTHWRCLAESAWSQEPAVQVAAWRLLTRLPAEPWARDLLDQIYLDDETRAWAEAGADSETASAADGEESVVHKDTHGAVLSAGDTVTLIKDLKVKGANFTAKRGTAVRNIALVPDNPAQIEGRVNDQRIVILTEFVKKAT
ncbi:PhnA domain-containing protein [Polymorphum gilvum]|uniref:Putative phosphonoacetate hydrolase PhnA n=1 Tax=Polymorphum gilvum (strain LMG 25793 / CGMCC 1.9160 / SL003B-26A1) TaxID=991905 RepID=F2J373_POLGS|nr:alkylphosphonate utilization protein [Polymorphum gilvum]ADZ69880.1 Putative phosphonoacetate hydrolase PhnA [Polymorphum gilvum SL003B-26A1]